MRLTTARYFTPSGRSIQAKGIEPDLVVEQGHLESGDQQPQARRREADLRGALANPDGPSAAPSKATQPPIDESGGEANTTAAAPAQDEDYQLARALDLLKGIDLYSSRTVE